MGNDNINASYDITAGEMNIKIPKETPGEEFPDLDLLTKLLAPRSIRAPERPLIEVIGGNDDDDDDHENNNDLNRLYERNNEQKLYENNDNDFLIRELN